MLAKGFRFCFSPLCGVLFTFPSRYWFTIGLSVVFSLAGWCRRIHTGFLRSRATQDTDKSKFYVIYGTFTLCGPSFQNGSIIKSLILSQSYNPNLAVTILVWAIPRSLATTCGIIVIFFSSTYLDVSVQWVSLLFG